MTASAKAATYAYVASAGTNEIIVLSLDPATGGLTEIGKAMVPGIAKAGGSIPMAVSPDKKFLYAGMRGEPLVVAAFAIDAGTGKLNYLGSGPLADSMPYIATDRTGKWLLSSSYSGNKATVNPIGADGVVQAPKQILATPPNAHAILVDKSNTHVLVTSLGGDLVNQYKFDAASGTLSPNTPAGTKSKDKAGPRHFRFSPDERFVYLLNELDATLCVFHYDAKSGTLGGEVQVVSLMPPDEQGKPWAAEVQLTPDGRFLYASERASNTLSAFKVDRASGRLTAIAIVPTERQPRSFQIDPSGKYLYVLGEKSDSMTSYAIDARTGALTKLKQYALGRSPNWIEIHTLP